ncbi:MAG: hypothetical protein ACRERC_23690 [Candidatus Binatia bacterium]
MSAGDVTAVVLTVDEPSTDRALASVARQTPAVAAVVVVRGTVPFHRALNAGAAQVRTPYFVQVDADMVLDPTCCAGLRACMADNVGVVIGFLRDPLIGRVGGIKLFRAACFADEQFPDSISPDTDFYRSIERRGWAIAYALRDPSTPGEPRHVFGDHLPDYTPHYTFRKFAVLGARHRHRRAAVTLLQLVRRLHASPHPAALVALIGTAYGISLPTGRDLLAPDAPGADFERLAGFLARAGAAADPPEAVRAIEQLAPRAAWERGYRCGLALHGDQAAAPFVAALRHLGAAMAGEHGPIAWAALAGLCHGLFADTFDAAAVDDAFARLNQVLPKRLRERPGGRA